jgi:hypothetical protein
MSRAVQSADDDDLRLKKLLDWAAFRHIWIHDHIEIRKSPSSSEAPVESDANREGEVKDKYGGEVQGIHGLESRNPDGALDTSQGFGAYVKHGEVVLERQVVVLVSKANMLSVRTTSLAPHIPNEMLYSSDASSGLLLALILQHELMLGERGPWWGYLQSLPKTGGRWGVDLPMFKPKNEDEHWSWFNATETGRMLQRAESDPTGAIEGLGMCSVSAVDAIL